MTKIAIINDTHFGVRLDSPVFLDHQENFFKNVFFPEIDKQKIKVVFDLGDTFDRRKIINFNTLKISRHFFFNELQKRNIEYHAVVGNHSVYYKNTNEINSMDLLLNEYNNFNFYIHETKELEFDNVKFLLVPWLTDVNIEKCLDDIKNTNASFILGHFEIKGFEYMKGSIAEHGLDRKIFETFEGVYSGHFHHPSHYNNIKYLGAQYEMDWSDYGEKRGFHVFDTKKRNLKFIENKTKIFHKIYYDDNVKLDNIDFSTLNNCFIKLIIKNKNNDLLYDEFVDKIVENNPADLKIIEDSLNLENTVEDDIIDESKNTKDILHDYIDNIETNLEKPKIKKLIDKLYIKANSLE